MPRLLRTGALRFAEQRILVSRSRLRLCLHALAAAAVVCRLPGVFSGAAILTIRAVLRARGGTLVSATPCRSRHLCAALAVFSLQQAASSFPGAAGSDLLAISRTGLRMHASVHVLVGRSRCARGRLVTARTLRLRGSFVSGRWICGCLCPRANRKQ